MTKLSLFAAERGPTAIRLLAKECRRVSLSVLRLAIETVR